ncbi:Na/Pi symporter [Lentisphaerota bacterium WC36G]|nr:Na/Pi symporter [Lentisphaerae bacterium WC36]
MKKLFSLSSVITVMAFTMLFFAGCKQEKGQAKVDKLHVMQGDMQTALAGEKFKKTVKIEVLGPVKKGLFGGKGSRTQIANAKVRLEAAEGSKLIFPKEVLTANAGGGISFDVSAGKAIGDQYLKIIPLENEKKAAVLRFISGVKIEGAKQETSTGDYLEDPLKVTIADANGKPIEACPVYFNISSSPKKSKAKLEKNVVYTNKEGVAENRLKMGSKTGTYKISVEIADEKNNLFVRSLVVKELGINVIGIVITVLGGLALFVFGMKNMSDGLQIIAGDKMKSLLHFFASNRVIAVMAGALVTAVIQSSSACTVMVIGFVNAGLLNLMQSIGIVFGANIGTTITAQMISFKLDNLAFPAIAIGMIIPMIPMFSKSNVAKGWGACIFGFGVLFFGMGIMGGELKQIGSFPSVIDTFNKFDCTPLANGFMPVSAIAGAILIGALVTTLVQSSSASMGIVLALAGGGLINFWTAIPLILGTNIGTTITAALAAIPANKPAKQAAVAHFLFNFVGSIGMIAFFYVCWPGTNIPVFLYIVNSITSGDVFAADPQNITRHIAMAHTLFNVGVVFLLIWFIPLIAKLCTWVIPVGKEEHIEYQYLEKNLLDTPTVALEQVILAMRKMLKESLSMIDDSFNKHFMTGELSDDDYVDMAKREEHIDSMQAEIGSYLVELTRRELTHPQSELIPLLLHCINDVERVADHAENMLGLTRRTQKSKENISKRGVEELQRIWHLLEDQSNRVIKGLVKSSPDDVVTALEDEKRINDLAVLFEKSHIKRLRRGECDAVMGVIFIEMIAELERIGDHLANIAERLPEMEKHYLEL